MRDGFLQTLLHQPLHALLGDGRDAQLENHGDGGASEEKEQVHLSKTPLDNYRMYIDFSSFPELVSKLV